ncbi:MAG: lysozyme inhibitor LprI family protein [Cyanobacteriota bacterium]|nr:lysozyme inhibitor LprI family protein [Cyanobacteriota bacterium]
MNKLSISLILASLSASSLLAIRTPAKQVVVENTIIECNPAGNTAEMKQCAAEEYEAADEKLNQTYQLALSQLDGEAKQRLKEAQRTWINFRDSTCSFEASSALGGTLEGLLYTGCLTEQTEKRTAELKGYFNDRASTFFGGGYTVTIEGSQGIISYRGCNSKNKCMYIPAASDYTQGGYTWENEGFTYKMSPVNNTGKYRLKIIDPEGKMLVNQVLSRMG